MFSFPLYFQPLFLMFLFFCNLGFNSTCHAMDLTASKYVASLVVSDENNYLYAQLTEQKHWFDAKEKIYTKYGNTKVTAE